MKVAITGHTSGIGQELYRMWPDAKVYSRSNGYDIANFSAIVEDANDCDVFINNAYSSIYQLVLLRSMYRIWSTQQKIIVCMGSRAANLPAKDNEYARNKRALELECIELATHCSMCRVVYIKPGYVDTPAVNGIKQPKLSTFDVAKIIKYTIESDVNITSISMQ